MVGHRLGARRWWGKVDDSSERSAGARL